MGCQTGDYRSAGIGVLPKKPGSPETAPGQLVCEADGQEYFKTSHAAGMGPRLLHAGVHLQPTLEGVLPEDVFQRECAAQTIGIRVIRLDDDDLLSAVYELTNGILHDCYSSSFTP